MSSLPENLEADVRTWLLPLKVAVANGIPFQYRSIKEVICLSREYEIARARERTGSTILFVQSARRRKTLCVSTSGTRNLSEKLRSATLIEWAFRLIRDLDSVNGAELLRNCSIRDLGNYRERNSMGRYFKTVVWCSRIVERIIKWNLDQSRDTITLSNMFFLSDSNEGALIWRAKPRRSHKSCSPKRDIVTMMSTAALDNVEDRTRPTARNRTDLDWTGVGN